MFDRISKFSVYYSEKFKPKTGETQKMSHHFTLLYFLSRQQEIEKKNPSLMEWKCIYSQNSFSMGDWEHGNFHGEKAHREDSSNYKCQAGRFQGP